MAQRKKTGQLVPLKEATEHRPWAKERFLRRLIKEKRIRHYKMGENLKSPVFIDLDDLDRYLDTHRVEPQEA